MDPIHDLLSWLHVACEIAGLVVAIRYLRLSPWMLLVAGAFGGGFFVGAFSQVLLFATRRNQLPGDSLSTLFAVSSLMHAVASATLVVGLALVFADLRARFHFMREVHENAREEEWKKSDAEYRAAQAGRRASGGGSDAAGTPS